MLSGWRCLSACLTEDPPTSLPACLLSCGPPRLLHFSLGPDRIARRRVELVLVATVIIAPVLFLDMLYGLHGMGDKPLTDYLFSSDPIGLTLPLFLYVPFKFLATVICVSLPLPVGLFTPTFTTGGAMGRVFGEVVNGYWPNLFMASTFDAAEFAIIGAAAFSAGVTRAISTAIIVFELTGQHHLHMPMSIAILAAYFVANRFTKVQARTRHTTGSGMSS